MNNEQTQVLPRVPAAEFDADPGPTCGETIKSLAFVSAGSALLGFAIGGLTVLAVLAMVIAS